MENVEITFTETLTEYLKNTVFDVYNISYAKIGSLLLSTSGVSDYSNLLVNGDTSNITLKDTEMPIIGTITLSEEVV